MAFLGHKNSRLGKFAGIGQKNPPGYRDRRRRRLRRVSQPSMCGPETASCFGRGLSYRLPRAAGAGDGIHTRCARATVSVAEVVDGFGKLLARRRWTGSSPAARLPSDAVHVGHGKIVSENPVSRPTNSAPFSPAPAPCGGVATGRNSYGYSSSPRLATRTRIARRETHTIYGTGH
jgi:hypothetical protein